MSDPNNETWRKKALGVLQACENELRRTTAIGMKMIHASKASSELHETYEEIGKIVVKMIETNEMASPSARVDNLIVRIRELEQILGDMEGQVTSLKKEDSNL
jgi:hypothetical protein